MTSPPATTRRTGPRAAGRVAPLCWIAVLLDGFDLVVVGTVVPTLQEPEEWASPSAGAVSVGAIVGPVITGALFSAGLAFPWGSYVFAVVGALDALALTVVRRRDVAPA